MIFAPCSTLAFIGQRKATGWFSAMLEPMTTMQSESAMLRGYMVAAPRPNRVPRPGTLELCHIRAWFSMATMPRPRMSFWWTWLNSMSSVAPPSEKIAGVMLTSLPLGSFSMKVSSRVFFTSSAIAVHRALEVPDLPVGGARRRDAAPGSAGWD